ncbi:MAG: cell division protein ZapA [Bacteroidales bacterium]|nr:cell division protein ZapA [Bacteroidales bacterium]
MDQSITLKIAGREYSLKVQSPEMEQLMRLGAESINRTLAVYDQRYPDKSLVDKLAFVTLREAVSRLSTERRMTAASDEVKTFEAEMASYLDGLK